MKERTLSKKWIFWGINGLLVLLALVCLLFLYGVCTALPTLNAANTWAGESDMPFAQLACYLPDDQMLEETDVWSFRQTLEKQLTDAALEAPENGSLYTDAYSGQGTLTVTAERGNAQVEVIGVGGDYFRFHPLQLRSGSYLAETDLMQDRVILDEELAWKLFGGYDLAGMTIYIGEKEEDSFVAFNGKEFATLPVSQSDFRDGIGRLSVISLENANEFKVNVSQSDIRTKVNILSSVEGFENMEVDATIGRAFNTPEMPVLEGYTFDALYVDEACIVKYNGTDSVSASTTFYAKYLNNSKTYHNVTLQSEIGGFDPITFTVEDGAVIGAIGDVFFSEGFDLKWKTEEGLFNELETAITGDVVLTAIWVEETIVLYHKMNGVVDESYLWEYLQDSNGWDSEYTAYDIGDTFVDANGNEIISSYYGSYQHETSFREYDTYSTFLLPGAGAITNLKKLDLTKEIVITYTANNWDTANNNYVVAGDITFQLFDNVLSALKAGHNSNENAKVAIMTSSLDLSVDFGRFKDVLNGARQKHESFKFEQDKQFIIKMFISEDGSENYVTVNGIKIEGAIEGVKRSDFKGGYAYLHIANNGSTHYFNCLLAQTSTLTLKETVNGTYSVDKTGEILFKDTVTITLKPDNGYAVKKVIINEEEYLPDSNNMVTFYKGWDAEEIEVIFDKAFTATFVVGEGASALTPQVVCTGEKFYKPSNPKKEGYKFVGWYVDEALTIEYDFKTLATADITLYAKWEEKPDTTEKKKGCKGEVGLSATIWASITLVSAGLAVCKKKKD